MYLVPYVHKANHNISQYRSALLVQDVSHPTHTITLFWNGLSCPF
jgi:hypothetical protein